MESAMMPFVDVDSGSEGFILVRSVEGGLGITMSLRDNGDLEVFLDLPAAGRFLELLKSSIANGTAEFDD